MEGSYADNYAFIGEWYDNEASLTRRFNIFYFPTDDSIEMFDLKTKKLFLRRTKIRGIKLNNFYLGCTLYIYGRLIRIVDFGCEATRKKLDKDLQVTFVIFKPQSISQIGEIISIFYEHGFRITRMKKTQMSETDITYIYKKLQKDPSFPFLLDYLSGQFVVGALLVGKDAVARVLKLVGDKDPHKAEPGTIRAKYGISPLKNSVDCADDTQEALESIEYFFPSGPQVSRLRLTATLSNCTLCIIRPHAIRENKLGLALQLIEQGGFDVTALNMIIVEAVNACEFFEVYKGIVPEYKAMVEELASGPCVALELVCKDKTKNTPAEFRKLVGPCDPEIARLLRPHTLRAKLGVNKVQNAIHCSDLPADGLLEVEYFFKILDF